MINEMSILSGSLTKDFAIPASLFERRIPSVSTGLRTHFVERANSKHAGCKSAAGSTTSVVLRHDVVAIARHVVGRQASFAPQAFTEFSATPHAPVFLSPGDVRFRAAFWTVMQRIFAAFLYGRVAFHLEVRFASINSCAGISAPQARHDASAYSRLDFEVSLRSKLSLNKTHVEEYPL